MMECTLLAPVLQRSQMICVHRPVGCVWQRAGSLVADEEHGQLQIVDDLHCGWVCIATGRQVQPASNRGMVCSCAATAANRSRAVGGGGADRLACNNPRQRSGAAAAAAAAGAAAAGTHHGDEHPSPALAELLLGQRVQHSESGLLRSKRRVWAEGSGRAGCKPGGGVHPRPSPYTAAGCTASWSAAPTGRLPCRLLPASSAATSSPPPPSGGWLPWVLAPAGYAGEGKHSASGSRSSTHSVGTARLAHAAAQHRSHCCR